MQNNSGLQSILSLSFVYKTFQELIGAHRWRRKFIRETVRPTKGARLVDIGCGPAQMLNWMPEVHYVGIDLSESYIETAKKAYGSRGEFLVGTTASLRGHPSLCNADIVMCCGVLHHLDDDEAEDLIRSAHEILKPASPGARFVALEAAWLPGQSKLSRWIVSQDRGKSIRTEEGYRALAVKYFSQIKVTPDYHPLRIPYSGLVMECIK